MRFERETALGLFLVVALLLGLGMDVVADDAAPARAVQADPIFYERSVYCPPPAVEGESESLLAVAGVGDGSVPIGVDGERREVQPGRTLAIPNSASADLVGYGAEVVASSVGRFTGDVGGVAAARCSKVASTRWFFAEGSSALGTEERLVIYNPFPDEAVVSVSLFTPDGEQGNANLSEGIAVPAGETTTIELNEFLRQERFVGAAVVANRGRVIAWRVLQVSSEDRPKSVQMTLGATAPAREWFFPEGGIGDGIDHRVTLLNPTDEEAVASVSLLTGSRTIQPPKLVEVLVPPNALVPLPLREQVGGPDRQLGGTAVVVRATTGTLVAEKTVYYDSSALQGSASEVGAPRASARWFVGPSVAAPDSDSIVLLNPGAEPASISLSLVREDGEPLEPAPLQDLRLKAGTRLKVPLGEWTRGRTVSVMVQSDQDVVAERFGSKGADVGSVMGVPVTQSVP